MKIAAAVILYNPTDSVIQNIEGYYSFVDKLYVFDNTEGEVVVKKDLQLLEKIEYYHEFENKGIAKRLNEACEKAINEGFEWILTMDQDSTFSVEAILAYLNCFSQFGNKEEVALFGIANKRQTIAVAKGCNAEQADDTITSGSLLNLLLFKKIGPFDEALFIDSVDREYCVRLKTLGYSIVQFTNIYLKHELGSEVFRASIKSLYTVKKRKLIHSPLRSYYIYRNILYLEKKYKNVNETYIRKVKKDVIDELKNCFFYGRNMKLYLKYIIKAKSDFKKGRMGKIDKEF